MLFITKNSVLFANPREIIQVEKPHQLYFRFNKYNHYFECLSDDIKEHAIQTAKKLNKRISGHLKIDMDYQEKSAFENKFISSQIIKNNKTKILITSHCFFDNPHCYGGLLFTDFYEWLSFLAEKSHSTDYDWYIKPHRDFLPGTIEALNLFISKFKNMKIINPETSFHQLKKEGIINVLTCYGSVGHELPMLGFNVINAGYNPHISFNFNVNCSSKNEYSKIIDNINDLELNKNLEEIYKFYYIHNIQINGDLFSQDGKKNEETIIEFTGTEFIDVFLNNNIYYKNVKNNLMKFDSFKSIYSWELLYKNNPNFNLEFRNNIIPN